VDGVDRQGGEGFFVGWGKKVVFLLLGKWDEERNRHKRAYDGRGWIDYRKVNALSRFAG
jgi:hypothetical protein